jgi:hypothetical protein
MRNQYYPLHPLGDLFNRANPNQPLTTALASWTAAAREARRRFVRLPFKGIQRHSKVFKAIQSIFEKKKDSFLCFLPQINPFPHD